MPCANIYQAQTAYELPISPLGTLYQFKIRNPEKYACGTLRYQNEESQTSQGFENVYLSYSFFKLVLSKQNYKFKINNLHIFLLGIQSSKK
ncbi:hypothetical protein DP116_20825 [Brasilonema bromeliae SPC951]|uniref:Uncharacterized protein n=1 Tax=Brasilonema bromeliae SPC951 TaxID=385972 RepID=A0ABX1PBJ6_9CYAN|nr:hypothetical protein [Brasilonema bromeliae SPC951]